MASEIEDKKRYLLHWMYDFIEDDDEPAYQVEDVEECDEILSSFIHHALNSEQRSDLVWLSSEIQDLVVTLNRLNQKHAGQLIESDQREDLCALIALVLKHCGHSDQGDITEPWREW
jgi:hypothetical protein